MHGTSSLIPGSSRQGLDTARVAHPQCRRAELTSAAFSSTGDVIWKVIEGEGKKGNKPATVNRYLCAIRALLRMARDEWQWIDSFPKIRLLPGEVERDRWLTREEAARLLSYCPPHLAAPVRFALATGCRASEIKSLE